MDTYRKNHSKISFKNKSMVEIIEILSASQLKEVQWEDSTE